MKINDWLKLIETNPDDENIRLLFHDWLEERGDMRSRLVVYRVKNMLIVEEAWTLLRQFEREHEIVAPGIFKYPSTYAGYDGYTYIRLVPPDEYEEVFNGLHFTFGTDVKCDFCKPFDWFLALKDKGQ